MEEKKAPDIIEDVKKYESKSNGKAEDAKIKVKSFVSH